MDSENRFQEMQIIEQNLQNLLLQKQAFQIEILETDSALKEMENSSDEVFKIIGQMMIKSEKKKIQEELKNKKRILELRTKTLEKQESSLTEQMEKIREELIRKKEK